MVIANCNMHTTLAEAEILARRVFKVAEHVDDLDIVLLPPVIWLPSLLESLHHRPRGLHFGVQNFYPQADGDVTGEIGTAMLKGLAEYVLIGHSDRRLHFGETNEEINKKVQVALSSGFRPIICVGELTQVMLKEKGRGRPTVLERKSDVLAQLKTALAGLADQRVEHLVICYEPLWAIGTGNNVSGPHVEAVLEQLRDYLASAFSPSVAERIRLIYGGSVNPSTIAEYLSQPNIDGVLVGKAALTTQTFLPIIEAVADRSHHLIQHPDHR